MSKGWWVIGLGINSRSWAGIYFMRSGLNINCRGGRIEMGWRQVRPKLDLGLGINFGRMGKGIFARN